jgi:hypothetical protein
MRVGVFLPGVTQLRLARERPFQAACIPLISFGSHYETSDLPRYEISDLPRPARETPKRFQPKGTTKMKFTLQIMACLFLPIIVLSPFIATPVGSNS